MRKSLSNDFTLANPVRAPMPGSVGDMRTPFHFSFCEFFAGRKRVSLGMFAVRRSWPCAVMGNHTKQSSPHRALVAQSNRPCNRTDHKRPLIRAPRNHDRVVAPTGHAGFRHVIYNRAIVTEKSGSPKCLVTF